MGADREAPRGGVWDRVAKLTKSAQERNTDPLLWSIQLSSTLNSAGLTQPSVELGHALVSHICWDNNVPVAWKFLDKALSLRLAPPLLVVALLASRVIPNRHLHPSAYRLYMELQKRHCSFSSLLQDSNYEKTVKSIDDIVYLSEVFEIQVSEPGLLVALVVFWIVWQLGDASLRDEGLVDYMQDKSCKWSNRIDELNSNNQDTCQERRIAHYGGISQMNTLMAIEMIADFFKDRVTSQMLFLVCQNLPSHWTVLVKRLQLLASKSSTLRNSKHINPETFTKLLFDESQRQPLTKSNLQQFQVVMAPGSYVPSDAQSHGASCSSLWLPIDLFLEDAMDPLIVSPTCAIDTLTGLVKSLRALHSSTWHDAFLGLWIAALRLVQRDRNPCEGPILRLDSCLSKLLSIVPLVLVHIIEEEECTLEKASELNRRGKEVHKSCRHELVSSLQLLGEYEGLLTPPSVIAPLANQAATKAALYLSGLNVGNGYLDSASMNEMPMGCAGNLRHLIVEACIARNLLDISSYMWPGYVNARVNQIPRGVTGQVTGWSSLMKDGPLTITVANALVYTPASSLAEIERMYEFAINGSDEEKILAAKVLCGASLVRGWNVQEHLVVFIVRLLSPPIPANYTGKESHLISYGPLLDVLLVAVATSDIVQIFSLHGLVPQLAGALMPICEVFGSCSPKVSFKYSTGEEINAHMVFSNAFTLLLKLWSFDSSPVAQAMGDLPSVGYELSPEYLLLVRNSQVANAKVDYTRNQISKLLTPPSSDPIFMDSFPKLKCWYRQHQACLASTLSGLTPGTPAHQIVEALLTMLFKKVNRGTSPGSSSSSGSAVEEAVLRLQVPAWDILEALPFVLDAALTACAHDKLSPRDLATGLKDLADFFPASLATIISYFAAEITRGIWKPAFMNGTDWPSPAANLATVEQQIQKLLAATGIDVPSLSKVSNSIPTLPLPLAALLSLAITYKIDKANERFLNLIGRSIVVLAAGCPWPCMPIVSSLWAQKAKRWSEFLIFNTSRTVFYRNKDAVVQLLRSCFSSVLGFDHLPGCKNGGVGALLGHGLGSHFSKGMSPVAPGIFYLRMYPFVRDIPLLTEEILSLMMMSVKDIASGGFSKDALDRLKKTPFHMRYGQVSLTTAMTQVKVAASVGASFVWLSGGLHLIQMLIKEILPTWFISNQTAQQSGESESVGLAAVLSGYTLAYFTMLCGLFAWGIDRGSPARKRRSKVLSSHLGFMATAIEGKVSLGCDRATWQAYVLGFLGLVVRCAPSWFKEVDIQVMKSLSKGLRLWNEEELAIALLGVGGIKAMGPAAELIIGSVR